MKKVIVFVFAVFALMGEVSGLDLLLKNGQLFNNVTITAVGPGFVAIVSRPDGPVPSLIVTTVPVSELTPVSLKALTAYLDEGRSEMMGGNGPLVNTNASTLPLPQGVVPETTANENNNTNPNTADNNNSNGAEQTSEILSSLTPTGYAPILNKLPPNASDFSSDPESANPQIIELPGFPHKITVDSIVMLENGTLGWAHSGAPGADLTAQNYGKIYIYGIYRPQGGVWFGNVYPTCKTIYYNGNYYPCYATSVAMARRIDKSYQY